MKPSLQLYDNLQFVYELDLARRELQSFGLDDPHFDLGERKFSLNGTASLNDEACREIQRRSAYFRAVVHGDVCKVAHYHYLQRLNRTGSVNQYLTHWFYPYKGKFHPQLIRGLMNIIGVRAGDTLLDPFVGSGTAVVEGQLLGASCIGVDISPLCCLISRVKTGSWQHLSAIDEATHNTLPCLEREAAVLQSRIDAGRRIPYAELTPPEFSQEVVPGVRDFARLCWLIAVSDLTRRNRSLSRSLSANWVKMRNSVADHALARECLGLVYEPAAVIEGDARRLPVADCSVDAIVTSPPYSLALNYVRNDKHALEAMGLDLDDVQEEFIGVRGRGMDEKFALYDADMRDAVREMTRVLKPGGTCAIVIGDKVHEGESVPTSETVQKWLVKYGLHKDVVIPKTIFGLYNVMQDEDILVYSKPN